MPCGRPGCSRRRQHVCPNVPRCNRPKFGLEWSDRADKSGVGLELYAATYARCLVSQSCVDMTASVELLHVGAGRVDQGVHEFAVQPEHCVVDVVNVAGQCDRIPKVSERTLDPKFVNGQGAEAQEQPTPLGVNEVLAAGRSLAAFAEFDVAGFMGCEPLQQEVVTVAQFGCVEDDDVACRCVDRLCGDDSRSLPAE